MKGLAKRQREAQEMGKFEKQVEMEKMKGCIKNDQWQYHPTQGPDGHGA